MFSSSGVPSCFVSGARNKIIIIFYLRSLILSRSRVFSHSHMQDANFERNYCKEKSGIDVCIEMKFQSP